MKRFILAVVLIATVAVGFAAQPNGTVCSQDAATAVRTAAELTSADVLSTTFTKAGVDEGRLAAIHVYATFTTGSLTSGVVSPAGCNTNAAAASYSQNSEYALTMTASGVFSKRVPIEAFGNAKYLGFTVKGNGTVAGSSVALKYSLEYNK